MLYIKLEKKGQKMNKLLKIIGSVLCITLFCASASGCNISSENEETQQRVTMVEILETDTETGEEDEAEEIISNQPEDGMVISTEYGDLYYPDQWREYITVEQNKDGDTITVTFESESDGVMYVLFEIIIGDDDGTVIGSLTDAYGVQRNVYLHATEIESSEALSEEEKTRFYAMQEELNYLIDNLQ